MFSLVYFSAFWTSFRREATAGEILSDTGKKVLYSVATATNTDCERDREWTSERGHDPVKLKSRFASQRQHVTSPPHPVSDRYRALKQALSFSGFDSIRFLADLWRLPFGNCVEFPGFPKDHVLLQSFCGFIKAKFFGSKPSDYVVVGEIGDLWKNSPANSFQLNCPRQFASLLLSP